MDAPTQAGPGPDPQPQPPSEPTPVGPTILGSDLRRETTAIVNGLSDGRRIEVRFFGSRAYTNGRRIVLPRIRDMAEIRYSTARALIGYAIHEVAHVRYTDFLAIDVIDGDAFAESLGTDDQKTVAQRRKLIRKFENCIEDYRIEREIVREYPGAKSDLEALRVAIHPRLRSLTTGWFADPRSCGPLALTWLGARLNGFQNPKLQRTLGHVPGPVMAIIEDWTRRMDGVAEPRDVVDLAIAFESEAQEYARATRDAAAPASADGSSDGEPKDSGDADGEEEARTDGREDAADDEGPQAATAPESAPEDQDDAPRAPEDGPSEPRQPDGEDEAPDREDPEKPSRGDHSDAIEDAIREDEGRDAPLDDTAPVSDPPPKTDAPETPPEGQASDEAIPEDGTQDIDFKGDRRERQRSAAAAPDADGARSRERGASEDPSKVDLNGDMLDDYEQGEAEDGGQERDPIERIDDASGDDVAGDEGPRQGDAVDEDDGIGDGMADDEPRGAFDDVLDEGARDDDRMNDLIEQVRDRIAEGESLPEETPDGQDGEVDPSAVLDEISDSNERAPDYDSSESDPDPAAQTDDEPVARRSHHYGDARFRAAPCGSDETCRHADMRQKAAGAISTTARTIRRLLMAEERSGSLLNRRSGEFDVRNVSAIARGTGTCYKRKWTRPAPRTLLVTLVDFSGSMDGDDDRQNRELESPIAIAMMGAMAIEQAVRGTSVNSAVYGYTGVSPTVDMTVFKEGVQEDSLTRRRIGSFETIQKAFTPTGEAMSAVASRMDKADEDRRILVVLTDGAADNMRLCADVSAVLIRRGIEVVVIGIQDDSAEEWAPVHHMISDLSELPAALLRTIDPRAAKRRRKLAA